MYSHTNAVLAPASVSVLYSSLVVSRHHSAHYHFQYHMWDLDPDPKPTLAQDCFQYHMWDLDPDPKPTLAQDRFQYHTLFLCTILEVIYVPDEVWG